MTTYNRTTDRKRLRYRRRRWQRTINALLALAVALAILVATAPVVQAAPACPNGTATPHGCVYQPTGMTCAWPARIVRIGNVAICWRPGAEVQP